VYDMYPWDGRGDGPRTRTPAPRAAMENGCDPDPATAAVQVALDRRDNGGEVTAEAVAAGSSRGRK
jgi:hypothetical protein